MVGFVYRVDMRLRPFGDSGPLVLSFGRAGGLLSGARTRLGTLRHGESAANGDNDDARFVNYAPCCGLAFPPHISISASSSRYVI